MSRAVPPVAEPSTHLPLVEQWFGEAGFAQLDPLLQQLHRRGGHLRGLLRVRFGKGLGQVIGAWLARRMGIPSPRPDNMIDVRIRADAQGLHWHRRFNGTTVLRSLFTPVGQWPQGWWVERSGAVRVALRVEIVDGAWHWRPARVWLHGVRIPLWLLPGSTAFKECNGSRYRFYVGLSLPLLGSVLSYEGDLFAVPAVVERVAVL